MGAAVSLSTSSVLATRIERVAEGIGLSEALLGVIAALAADAPEITSAVAAITEHKARVGAGVVLGSVVFNLFALMGLGALVTGRIPLHRKVVALAGVTAALVGGGAVLGVALPTVPWVPLGLVVAVLAVYLAVLGTADHGLGWLPAPRRMSAWLREAVAEEESELEEVLRPDPGDTRDALVAVVALVIVVAASVVMERSAVSLGSRWGVPQIVVGTLVLGSVTGLPNAVASTYLARRGRGAAAFSTALNSNNFNILIGLLVPAAAVGLGARSGQAVFVAVCALSLTLATVIPAHFFGGLSRSGGVLVLLAYAGFVVSVVVVGSP
jgi:cation:H+ antiporter